MIWLPDWVEVGAPVKFRRGVGAELDCTIDRVTSAGTIRLSNGETFDSSQFRMSGKRHADDDYFEKINRHSKIRKTLRRGQSRTEVRSGDAGKHW
ncbi:hypothetical protein AB0N05_19570 [Nocardia sp. NPDC051030]|uniref:hypothetical protein n=1 Tax=Nocardia sp. NPDC051030 TaxID=3155162 RepID=UPI00343649D0